jgi:hypothetical protein
MKKRILVFSPGQSVMVGDDIHATILGVCIRACNHVTYEVEWWDGRDRKVEWLEESSIGSILAEDLPIGFKVRNDKDSGGRFGPET